jgi:hypothetical protein
MIVYFLRFDINGSGNVMGLCYNLAHYYYYERKGFNIGRWLGLLYKKLVDAPSITQLANLSVR